MPPVSSLTPTTANPVASTLQLFRSHPQFYRVAFLSFQTGEPLAERPDCPSRVAPHVKFSPVRRGQVSEMPAAAAKRAVNDEDTNDHANDRQNCSA